MASNGFSEVQYRKLAKVKMAHYFDGIILSEAAGANKPSPLFFEYALSKIGLKPYDVIMIGDNYSTDIVGAMNAEIDQIYFNPKRTALDATDKEPTYMVATLKEIEGILGVNKR
jgi:putative hydrolase of the HAD superfamily